MSPQYIQVAEASGGVATITLNRPPANPIDIALLTEMEEALGGMARNDAVRCLVITGEGDRFFSGGADIKQFLSLDATRRRDFVERGIRVFDLLEELPKPVIAALNGFALGGAGELAMACDIRIAAQRARLGQPEINLGLLPGWAGIQRLVRIVGEGRARQLLLTGEIITADEAYRIGLVNKVVPDADLMTETYALAAKLAQQAPGAVRETKQVLLDNRQGPMGRGSIQQAGKTFERMLEGAEAKEGISAFLEKRPPKFTGS